MAHGGEAIQGGANENWIRVLSGNVMMRFNAGACWVVALWEVWLAMLIRGEMLSSGRVKVRVSARMKDMCCSRFAWGKSSWMRTPCLIERLSTTTSYTMLVVPSIRVHGHLWLHPIL